MTSSLLPFDEAAPRMLSHLQTAGTRLSAGPSFVALRRLVEELEDEARAYIDLQSRGVCQKGTR